MTSTVLSRRVALVTGNEMAKADPESHLLVAALVERGVAVDVLPWQAAVDWSTFPLVVVRTPWDYFRYRDAFLVWAEQVERVTRLVNPSALLRWNSHKGYLRELAAQGVPTVPTLWLDRGAMDGMERLDATGWSQVVIKPAISIGAIGALRGEISDPALRDHLRGLLAEGDVMVQPYVGAIAELGELSLVYFGDDFSHAIRKMPKAGDYRVQDMYGGSNALVEPPAEAMQLARQALAWVPHATTYARVDMVCDAGRWLLMELELIEPELFLPLAEDSARRFADAIIRQLPGAPAR